VPVDRAGTLLSRRLLVAAVVAVACALAVPASAAAEQWTVNTVADEADAAVDGGGCATATGKCSLRAALEEANFSAEYGEVIFDEETFDGGAGSAIALGGELPAIEEPLRINGRECATAAGVGGPCVEVDGIPTAPALAVDGASEVEIEGLAITAAETGLAADEASFLRVRSNWFGVTLGGAAAGNGVGILLGPGSDNSRIGGEGPEAGNLFANSDGIALHLLGVSGVKVLGDEFGVAPGGTVPAPNQLDVRVGSSLGSPATGNSIGTRVGPAAASSAACDGGCNLLAAAGAGGIELAGDGALEGPAADTTILGNYLGLDLEAGSALAGTGTGIDVGTAARTVIGGPRTGEPNRIAGGSAAVSAGPGAVDLVVVGNLVGGAAGPPAAAAAPADGIVIDSAGLTSAAVEAIVSGNQLELSGGVGIEQDGFGAAIAGNRVAGADTGIRTAGPDEEHGNRIEANRVEGTAGSGILLQNDGNEVLGNEVEGALGAGIEVSGPQPFGASGNRIGGDTPASENVIDGAGSAAVSVHDAEGTMTEVARNRGSGNLGPFIRLSALAPATEPTGPNGGVQPPAIETLTSSGAAGVAEPGAVVRLFRKATSQPGEIESFLGRAIADEEGNWSLAFAALPAGASIAATQTTVAGGTSEAALASPAPVAPPAGGGAPGANADTRPPRTRILAATLPRRHPGVARFRFAADEVGSRFQCKLDRRPFRACRSPQEYRHLRHGPHVFRVRAVDPAGNVDPTPARRRFRVDG
jgi:CSLREA domain-containing protein